MKTKTIYLLRHGETDFNKKGQVQGRGVNSSLNANGREQAEKVFEGLRDIRFDTFYSSSLIRTKETLQPFSNDAIALEGFDEISWGDHEGMDPKPEAKEMYLQTIKKWRAGELHHAVGGGESPLDVMSRQQDAMKQVLDQTGNNILVCMHGRAIRILLCWLLNYPLNYMDGFPHQNCSYYSLVFNGTSFALNEFNVTSHLNG